MISTDACPVQICREDLRVDVGRQYIAWRKVNAALLDRITLASALFRVLVMTFCVCRCPWLLECNLLFTLGPACASISPCSQAGTEIRRCQRWRRQQ